MSTMKIKKGDTVRVIAGTDKGSEGKVIAVKQHRPRRGCKHDYKTHQTVTG